MQSRPWLWFPLGVAAAAVGLLPWVVHGGGLPLQNLAEGANTRPFVLLPFSQYAIGTLASLLVVGGAIGGLVSRLLPGGTRWSRRLLLLLLGVLLVQAIAIVQTATVVGGVLQRRQEATLYLALLVAGSIVSALLGALVLLLTSSAAKAPVVVGVALAAALGSTWAGTVITAPTELYQGPLWPFSVLGWSMPILIGVAVAWSGVASIGRAVAAAFAALALWIGPAINTAIVNSIGTRVYAKYPSEMLQAGIQVFTMALGSLELVLPPLLVAAAIATVGIVFRSRASRPPAATE